VIRHLFAIGLAAGLFLSNSALSQELPGFNFERHCKVVASWNAGPKSFYSDCMYFEQSAYAALKNEWERYKSSLREYCIRVAISSMLDPVSNGGSYQGLRECIRSASEPYK
jgi:hypothetical protein